MIIIMICLITFVIIAALMGGWGSKTSSLLEALFDFFSGNFGGG